VADNVPVTPGSGANIATDQLATGEHVQYVKLMDGTLDGTTKAAVGAAGLKVDASGAAVPVTDNNSTLSVDDGAGSLTVDGTVTANAGTGPWPVTDNSGSLTVDAPVATPVFVRLSDGAAAITALPVTDNSSTLSVDDGAGSLTVDNGGTFAVQAAQSGTWTVAGGSNVFHVDDNASTISIDDGAGSITVDGTVAATQSGSWTLAANQSVNNAQIGGNAIVASVTGVQDVMPRKRTGSTGLAPNYAANRITSKTTTTITSATAYVQCIVLAVSAAGTSWTIVIQNKEATPKILVPSITASVPTTGPLIWQFAEPILMTSGIDVVTGGTTAGTLDIYFTYWQ